MHSHILILNGPNLNLVGVREPEIYGSETIDDVAKRCAELAGSNIQLEQKQSNHEGQLIDWIHDAREKSDVIILNAGGYTHTSVAILDALRAFNGLVIELHISQVHKRESYRHHSYISSRADAVIAGFGVEGYILATRYSVEYIAKNINN